jgi:hypothetical protein
MTSALEGTRDVPCKQGQFRVWPVRTLDILMLRCEADFSLYQSSRSIRYNAASAT